MEESESLAMFVEELCRPVRLSFQKKAPLFGLESLRFALSTDTFDYSAPENCGFCVPLEASFYGGSQNESCLPDGLLDLSQCRSLPMVASNPHFFEAAPEVKKLFPRTVRKTRDREVITVDVEPKSGTVLRMNKRLQYNVLFQNFPDVPSFSVMRSGVYPMFWVNETYSIGDANLQTLKEDLFSPVATWKLVCYIAGVGLGGLFIVLSLLAGLCTILRSRKESRRIHITSASAPTSSRVVPSSEGASPTLRNRRH
uniref:Protein croquemort n=1 Tax=Steinernema glaseri TaxID=37863 RepID=A0A1I7YCP6_9BILA